MSLYLKELKEQLKYDKRSALYLNDNISNGIIKKIKRSSYILDKQFLKELTDNNVEDIPLVQPLFTPFSRRKNDQQSTLYSMNGPFQRIHADLADINYLKPNATEPKYILVVVDLFSSKVYLYPLKNKAKLIKGMQYFYSEIYEARSKLGEGGVPSTLYLQVDQEFNRRDLQLLNIQNKVEMYNTKMNDGHAFGAEQKIRELKIILTKQNKLSRGDRRMNLYTLIKDAETNMNETTNSKYGVQPSKAHQLSVNNDDMRRVFNLHRVNKIQNNYGRTAKYESSVLDRQNSQLRELFLGDHVFVEAGRIKKKDKPGVLGKATTELKPHFNTKKTYIISNKVHHRTEGAFSHYFYKVEPVENGEKELTGKFGRDELFALIRNKIA